MYTQLPYLQRRLRRRRHRKKAQLFDRLEAASEHFEKIGDESIINMLNEAVAALEKEDAEEETKEAE